MILRHLAARLRHHAVGVSLRLVDRAIEIDARGLHVAEGVDHLRRRIDLLQLHLLDHDAGAVMVERLLHQFLHRRLDGLARAGEDRLNVGAADHLAHGAFGHRLHRAFRILDVEQIVADAGRLDLPQHREIDVDDVLVAGEHQAFLRHVARRGAAAAHVLDRAHADVDLVDAQRLRREHRLDRIGQVVIQSRLHLAHVLAEAQHHAEFVRLNPEEAGKSPQRQHRQSQQRKAPAAEAVARQEAAQFVLAAAENLLQVRRRGAARRLRSRAPGALTARNPRTATAAALIAPWHRNVSRQTGSDARQPYVGRVIGDASSVTTRCSCLAFWAPC